MLKEEIKKRNDLNKEINNLKKVSIREMDKEKSIALNKKIKKLELHYAIINANIKYGGKKNEK